MIKNLHLGILGFICYALASTTVLANPSISISAKLQPTGWNGDNNGGKSYEASGNLLSLGVSIQEEKLYGGLILQGGSFNFDSPAPEMLSATGAIATDNVIIDHGEFDLYAGYYFWSNVSLFVDIKSISNTWRDKDYSVDYTGLGFGVTGFYPMTSPWIFYGTFGLVPLKIKANKTKIGKGIGSALEFGFVYKIQDTTNLSIGLKLQSQHLEFDYESRKQTHNLSGLNFGIQHRF